QRVHVVLLERLHVAVEQLRIYRIDGHAGVRDADLACLERRAGALERAIDGGDAGLEQLGDLRRLPAENLAENQHGPLPRREVLERGDEREPERLTGLRDLGRISVVR